MPAIILSDNGVSSGSAGLKTSGSNDGVLQLQTTTSGGTPTTAISISNTQVVTYTNQPTYTGGTANGVLYLNGSKAVTSGTALVFDGNGLTLGGSAPRLLSNMSGGQSTRFGIQNSTTNGNTRFYLYPNGTGNISAINMWNNSDPTAANYSSFDLGIIGTSDIRFSSSAAGTASYLPFTWYMASEIMRLDTNGVLGLGVAPNTWTSNRLALQIGGSSGGYVTANSGLAIGSNYYYGSGDKFVANGYAPLYYMSPSTGQHQWYTSNNNASGAGAAVSLTQAMTLDASGNLLIGRTSSLTYSEKIMVEGAIGLNTNPIRFYNSGAYYGGIGSSTWAFGSGSNTDLSVLSSDNLLFGAGGQARARITSVGDLLINTTSNSFSGSVLIAANSATRNAVVCQDTGTNYGTSYYYQWFVNSAGNSAGSISHTAATTIAFQTSSDKRLKHNIVAAPSALQKINDVKVCSFDWIEDGHHVDYGFIAQDLYDVIPEVVGKGDDSETLEDPKGTWQVEYGRLTPILVKAIQEQQAIIEQLQADVAVLKGQA